MISFCRLFNSKILENPAEQFEDELLGRDVDDAVEVAVVIVTDNAVVMPSVSDSQSAGSTFFMLRRGIVHEV